MISDIVLLTKYCYINKYGYAFITQNYIDNLYWHINVINCKYKYCENIYF